jgi:CBS domain-containing protein
MKVHDILAAKGSRVVTIEKTTTVLDAMSIFAAHRIGSLLIVDKSNNILGIIGARDVLMAVVNHLEKIRTLTVETIMTTDLLIGTEDDHIDYILAIMTENRIRHIPIMNGRELKGMVSIGDVVKALLKEKDVENRYLKDYIAAKYPA